MIKISFAIIILISTSWIHSCSSAENQKEPLKEELMKGILQQCDKKNYDVMVDELLPSSALYFE